MEIPVLLSSVFEGFERVALFSPWLLHTKRSWFPDWNKAGRNWSGEGRWDSRVLLYVVAYCKGSSRKLLAKGDRAGGSIHSLPGFLRSQRLPPAIGTTSYGDRDTGLLFEVQSSGQESGVDLLSRQSAWLAGCCHFLCLLSPCVCSPWPLIYLVPPLSKVPIYLYTPNQGTPASHSRLRSCLYGWVTAAFGAHFETSCRSNDGKARLLPGRWLGHHWSSRSHRLLAWVWVNWQHVWYIWPAWEWGSQEGSREQFLLAVLGHLVVSLG